MEQEGRMAGHGRSREIIIRGSGREKSRQEKRAAGLVCFCFLCLFMFVFYLWFVFCFYVALETISFRFQNQSQQPPLYLCACF